MEQIINYMADLWAELLKINWPLRLLTLLIPTFTFLFYNNIPVWIRRFRIHALNNNLKYGTNLSSYVICFYLLLSFGCIITLLSLVISLKTESLFWMLLLFSVPFLYGIFHLYFKFKRKKDERLVGLIASDFKSVSDVILNPEQEFHLAYCKDVSFEKRKPILDPKEIEKKCNNIADYYEALKNKIIGDEKVNQDLFIIKDSDNRSIHICDYFRELYCPDVILHHIKEVEKKRTSDNSINFIGDKIGIYGFHFERKSLHLHSYMTDHFTWKVFKNIYQEEKVKNTLKPIICRTNYATSKEQSYIISSFKFLFSSFGIDIIIHGTKANGKKGMLVGLRNGGIETKGVSKLHVPVNESFSSTDRKPGDANRYSLYECACRGVEEELGIRRELIKDGLSFYDFAIVTDEGEIGLGCQLDLTSIMPLEQSRLYPGQDKFLELKELIIAPYLPFLWDSRKYPQLLYKLTGNDIFCFPWESFTPLLYQRIIVRNYAWSSFLIKLFDTITITLLTASLYYIFYYGETLYSLLLSLIASGLITLVWFLIKNAIPTYRKHLQKIKYIYLRPLISQWNSDVSVIQSTANNIPHYDENPILKNIEFGLSTEKETGGKKKTGGNKKSPLARLPLSQLELVDSPYCNSRSQITFDNAECPIAFYHVRKSEGSVPEFNRLFFKIIPCISTDDCNLLIYFEVRVDSDEKKSYHFSKDLSDGDCPELSHKPCISEDDKYRLSKLYSISEVDIDSMEIYELPESFKKKYMPYDFFYYKRNYYWSLDLMTPGEEKWLKDLIGNKDKHLLIDKNSNLYERIKNVKETTTFLLVGKSQDIVKCLVRFLTNQQNLKRVSPLDIYMLQLSFIRRGDDDQGILLADMKRPWYSRKK